MLLSKTGLGGSTVASVTAGSVTAVTLTAPVVPLVTIRLHVPDVTCAAIRLYVFPHDNQIAAEPCVAGKAVISWSSQGFISHAPIHPVRRSRRVCGSMWKTLPLFSSSSSQNLGPEKTSGGRRSPRVDVVLFEPVELRHTHSG